MTLEALRITHRFDVDPVLDAVDLAIAEGQSVALMGANGAGKTTLLRVLGGLCDPDSGRVRIGGTALEDLTRREIARRISVVPQVRSQVFGFTALEFALMGLHASMGRFSLDGQADRERAISALESLEVAHLADRSMTQLSGGEAQRVTMARTVASGASYWLLDEPTSNLDLHHQIALLATVRRHVDAGGAALVIVHDPNLLPRWFDRVVVLDGGSIAADGPPDQVLSPDLFERAFGQRMKWVGTPGAGAWIPDLDPNVDAYVQDSATE